MKIKTFKQFINEFEIEGDILRGYEEKEFIFKLDEAGKMNPTALLNNLNNIGSKLHTYSSTFNQLNNPTIKFEFYSKGISNYVKAIIGIKTDDLLQLRENGTIKSFLQKMELSLRRLIYNAGYEVETSEIPLE